MEQQVNNAQALSGKSSVNNSLKGDSVDQKVTQQSQETGLQQLQELNGESFEEYQDEIFRSDDFRMYKFKVFPCSKRYYHDWTTCAFSHIGEKAKRRDPLKYKYIAVACPDMKKLMSCVKGDQCPLAHSVFEYWLHPSRYRTQMCNQGPTCKRKVCFFAHKVDELRTPTDDYGLQTFMENGLEYPTLPVDQLYINFDNQDTKSIQVDKQIEQMITSKLQQLSLQNQVNQRRSVDFPLTNLNQNQVYQGNAYSNTFPSSQNQFSYGKINTPGSLQPINENLGNSQQDSLDTNQLLFSNGNSSQKFIEEHLQKQQQIEKEVSDLKAFQTIQNKIRTGELHVQDLPPDLQDLFRRRSMDTIYTLLQRDRQNQWAMHLQRSYFQKRGLSLDQQQEALQQLRQQGLQFTVPPLIGQQQHSVNLEQLQSLQNYTNHNLNNMGSQQYNNSAQVQQPLNQQLSNQVPTLNQSLSQNIPQGLQFQLSNQLPQQPGIQNTLSQQALEQQQLLTGTELGRNSQSIDQPQQNLWDEWSFLTSKNQENAFKNSDQLQGAHPLQKQQDKSVSIEQLSDFYR